MKKIVASITSPQFPNVTFDCATEPGFAGDIGAIEVWLIDFS